MILKSTGIQSLQLLSVHNPWSTCSHGNCGHKAVLHFSHFLLFSLLIVTPPEIDCQPQDMKEAILQSEVSFSVRLHLPVRPVRSEASNTTTVERGSGTKGGEEEGGGVGKGEKGGGEKENGGGGEGEGGIAAADPQEGQKNYKGERKSGGSEGEGKTEATIVGTGESMWEKDLLFTWEMKRDRPSVLQNHGIV